MIIGLHDADRTGFPNLALMKISAKYKSDGHNTELYRGNRKYDKIYSSKVFTFSQDGVLNGDSERGGIGYKSYISLPDDIEHICPDYSLYGVNRSYGFLTRGCIRKCPWCFVPRKEGQIRAHADIEEFTRHREVILMDNNILASDHGIEQIEKIAKLGLKVDFNQGLDARLIDDSIAKRLSKIKYINQVRLACDSPKDRGTILKAVTILRWNNVTPSRYFVYVLVQDVQEALETVRFLKGLCLVPFCQPYRDEINSEPTREQRDLARWVNMTTLFKAMTFEDYLVMKNRLPVAE